MGVVALGRWQRLRFAVGELIKWAGPGSLCFVASSPGLLSASHGFPLRSGIHQCSAAPTACFYLLSLGLSVCVCVVASYVSGSVCVYVVASYVSGSVCVCVVASYVSGSVCLYVVASYVSGSVCLCMSWLAMSLGLSMCLSRHLSGFVSTDSVISISIFLHYITEPCCPSSSTLSKLPDKPAGELVPTCFILGPRECCPGLIRSSMLPRRPVCASQEMQHGRGMGGGWGSVMPPLLLQDTWSGWGTLCCHGTASHGLLHCRRLAGAPCMPAPSVNTPPPVPGGLTLGTAWRRWCRAIVPAPRLGNPLVPGRGSSLETP
ncbi:uncharacterized protein LOC127040646 isoform X2 [Gopherus flavomarginatus]|uniref:uncharacterized protein LOC127040646 isoform X2 n=1 Tax=Gopherus flavomarginatus TaxID=286002 RepID=UPI0021CC110D|nr:uncharacterized protein LOC127040646 isoform X2 [Gopherus flavomarginatus]